MADVDFSHAVLDVNPNVESRYYPMQVNEYLGINKTASLYNGGGVNIAYNNSKSIITNTPLKTSIMFSGNFDRSGTEFYISDDNGHYIWKVTNISFSGGDTYSFIIDIETSGNT